MDGGTVERDNSRRQTGQSHEQGWGVDGNSLFGRKVEQPTGLDQFESFVCHGGRIDCNFLSSTIRVIESLLRGSFLNSSIGRSRKGPPEAVRTMESREFSIAHGCIGRQRCVRCPRNDRSPVRFASRMTLSPPTTRASLFAERCSCPLLRRKGWGVTRGPDDCHDCGVRIGKGSQGFDAFLSKKKLRLIGKGNAGVGGVLEASVGN